jgi:hypothetical protein
MLASNQNPNGKLKVFDGIFVFVIKHLVEENAGAGTLAPESLGTKIPGMYKPNPLKNIPKLGGQSWRNALICVALRAFPDLTNLCNRAPKQYPSAA